MMILTTVREFLVMDLSTRPVVVSNPPKSNEIAAHGVYVWGTDKMVSHYLGRK